MLLLQLAYEAKFPGLHLLTKACFMFVIVKLRNIEFSFSLKKNLPVTF